jgi:hypothetical protein
MARDGLFAFGCAVALVAAGLLAPASAAPPDDRDAVLNTTLAVQTALAQGRDHLLRGNPRGAVEVLESQVSRCNGNKLYLDLLAQAYRGYIKDLRLSNQEALAETYVRRLSILDRGSALAAPSTPTTEVKASAPEIKVPAPPPSRTDGTSRGSRPDDSGRKAAQELLGRAEREFRDRHYGEARTLFEQAHVADQASTDASHDRWAYCKLHHVVEQINQTPAGRTDWAALEDEVRQALKMSPQLADYGQRLLDEIGKNRAGSVGPAVAVRHFERDAQGWYRAETSNFRVFYRQSREQAEQVAQVAERTRLTMHRKWFGGTPEEWNPRCDIFLHLTAQDYTQATHVPGESPGHSSIRTDQGSGRVIGRRIDVHVDNPNMAIAVLPHETTHVVLAGQFGNYQVPRWADEGMAVMSEPRDKIERHLQNLPRCREQQELFSLRDLMQMPEYPEPRRISAFYAESVSVVDFLSNQRGPQEFAQFVRDGLRSGYETALQKHYGYRDFRDLQQRWQQYAFGDATGAPTGVARGSMQ